MVVGTHLISSVTNTAQTVEVRVSRTVRNLNTSSSVVFSTSNTNTSLQYCIISLIFVALRSHIDFDTVSINISMESQETLTSHTVECLISSTPPASIQNPVVAIVTVALSVFEVSIDSTVLVT